LGPKWVQPEASSNTAEVIQANETGCAVMGFFRLEPVAKRPNGASDKMTSTEQLRDPCQHGMVQDNRFLTCSLPKLCNVILIQGSLRNLIREGRHFVFGMTARLGKAFLNFDF
jgi:hypothetical protein